MSALVGRLEGADRRAMSLVVLGTQAVLCLALLVMRLEQPDELLPPITVALVTYVLVLVAALRGLPHTPEITVLLFSLLVGSAIPEPGVTQVVPIEAIMPACIALILASPRWVAIAMATTYGTLLLRAGGTGVYARPDTLIFGAMLLGALVAGRLLAEGDRRRAEAARRELADVNGTLETRVRERTEDVDRARREVEQMSYAVSHDLRTPLRSIDGFAALAAESVALDSGTRRNLSVVRDSARRMERLIDDLVAFVDLGRRPLSARPVDLAAVACAAVADARRRTGSDCEIEIASDLGSARVDPELVRIALAELLANALEHAGSTVRVGRRAGRDATLYVQDDGPGIDAGHADTLFAIFDPARAPHATHTGMGLARVHRIAARHGGSVRVEDSPAGGATFLLTLPRS